MKNAEKGKGKNKKMIMTGQIRSNLSNQFDRIDILFD